MIQSQKIESIDKILEYLEQSIEEQESENPTEETEQDIIKHLIDVHGLLTRFKVVQVENEEDVDDSNTIAIYSYMVMSSLTAVLGNWESKTHVVDGRILMCNDIVYLDVNMDGGRPGCMISLFHRANPVIVAEVINTLKDIFGTMLKVSSECFTTNEATGEYIWGDEEISKHLKAIHGVQVKPIIFFEDSTVGNC